MRCLVMTALVLGACSEGPQRTAAQPSWRGGAVPARRLAGPVTFAPTSEPVARYNEPVRSPPRTPLNDAVIDAVATAAGQAGLRAPVPDARLFRACAELAEIVPEDGLVGYSLIEFALQRNGIIEPSPHLLVVWGEVDAIDQIVKQLQPRLTELLGEGATRLGVGAAKRRRDGTGAVVFALLGSGVTTAPIPRVVGRSATIEIDAFVDARYRYPSVAVLHDNGTVDRVDRVARGNNSFVAQVACGSGPGTLKISISASDASGTTVLASFPVWCGTTPPSSFAMEPPELGAGIKTPQDAERALFESINRTRVSAGVPAVRWDERLAQVARAHAEEMQRSGVVAHISPTAGTIKDRMRAANLETGVVQENIVRAYGIAEAHRGLMELASGHASIMSSVATRVGIGIAFGDRQSSRQEMFIAELFTGTPPTVDPVGASELVEKMLRRTRPTLVRSPDLGALAQRLADGYAAGLSRDVLLADLRRDVAVLRKKYNKLTHTMITVASLDALVEEPQLSDFGSDVFGVGVAQGIDRDIGENAIWVVLVFAPRQP